MKTLKTLASIAIVAASAVIVTGCSSAQKGAAGGGLAGGIAGAVVGNNWVPIGPTTGAVVGGSSGAAIGGLAGDAYDQITDDDKSRELQNLRAELASREAELAALRNGGPTNDELADLAAMRDRIGQLEAELAAARQEALNRVADANGNLGDLQRRLDASEGERDALKGDLDKLNEQKAMLEADVERLMQEANRLQQLLDDKSDIIGKTSDDAAAKDRELAALRDDLNKKASDLDAYARDLADKEALLNRKQTELAALQNEMQVLQTSLNGKDQKLDELRNELNAMNVQFDETSRGLTLTIVNSLLYTAGSSELSADGQELIGKVAAILNEKFPGREFLVEGHTDNQPIVHSGWRSNWELGAARSLNILHELVDRHGIDPSRVSATSYGEFRPSSSNVTATGQRENRRAVIVILPEKLTIERQTLAQAN